MPYNPAPGEQAPSEEAKRKAEAAKRFIENMYKMQSQNSRERRERCDAHPEQYLYASKTDEEAWTYKVDKGGRLLQVIRKRFFYCIVLYHFS